MTGNLNRVAQPEVTPGRPYFSIIMPCYNSEKFIEESINSVLSQKYDNFELIVVDDGSDDSSVAIVERIKSSDSRVRLAQNSHHRGASGARNCGAQMSVGNWVCFLDSDDVYAQDALEKRFYHIAEVPDCSFFSCDFFLWTPGSDPELLRQTEKNNYWSGFFSRASKNKSYVLDQDPGLVFIEAPLAWTGGVTISRILFEELGGFDESLIRGEDDHLWIRAAVLAGSVALINEADAYYRLRNDGLSQGAANKTPDSPIMVKSLFHDPLLKRYKKYIIKKLDKEYYLLSLFYREQGNRCLACKFALKSFFFSGFDYGRIRNLLGAIFLKA
jgi:glycosyltransferase involved in cell wall biosynthesis